MILTILLFILILSLLVFVHELGHFWTARKLKVGVEEFGFGFPPRLFGIRRGSTIYSLNLIPFGGFVRLKGEDGIDKAAPDSFVNTPPGKRAIIVGAGVIMNVVLAFVLLGFAFGIGVPSEVSSTLPGATVTNVRVLVTEVLDDSPAEKAGLQPGDQIVRVEGIPISDDAAVRAIILDRPAQPLAFERERDGELATVTVTPTTENGVGRIGIGLGTIGTARYGFGWAVVNGVRATGQLIGQIVVGLGDFARQLVVERRVSADVAGPVGIAVLTGQVSQLGLSAILQFMAILSLSLAVMNVLPIPALDGGRLFFILIEKIRGRAMNPRAEAWVHNIGFAVLLVLILAISVRDVQRFSVIDAVKDVFTR